MEIELINNQREDSFMNVKHWKRVGDDRALHALGNGQMCACEGDRSLSRSLGRRIPAFPWGAWRWRGNRDSQVRCVRRARISGPIAWRTAAV